MKALNDQLQEVESLISKRELKNENVSKANVAWHLDHSLRVINSIVRALENSNPEDYKYKLNIFRHFFLKTRTLPRGRAKAPRSVRPEEVVQAEDISRRLEFAKKNILKLEKLPMKAHFPHPFFGTLKRNESIKFIRIHTKHHLKIIRDILK